MAVSTTTRKQQFVLDGGTAAFAFTFRALLDSPSDIKCTVTTAGTDTILAYTTNYSVAINSDGIGGTVTLVSAGTIGLGTLTVYRETTKTQESDYDDYNQFPANTLETDLDRCIMIAQENAEAIDRSMRLPITVSGVSVELPVPVANKVLGWNSAATGIENKVAIDGDSVTAAAGSATAAATSATIALAAQVAAQLAETNAESAQLAAENAIQIAINLQTGNYTLALTDVNKLVDLNTSGSCTLTIPSSGAVNIPTGSVIMIRQLGAGQVTITTSATVTIYRETGLKTTGQYAFAALLKTGTDTWAAAGALEA